VTGHPNRFTVTELRNALRCPRVFVLGRMLGRTVSYPIGSSCLGATFHRLLERFAAIVDQPPKTFAALAARSPRDVVARGLSHWLLQLLVSELAADATLSTMPAEVDDLAEALREIARHLADSLVEFDTLPSTALKSLVRAAERPVSAYVEEIDVTVAGRIDALYQTVDRCLQVVEYKLTDATNDALDQAQVSLYRELLRREGFEDPRPRILRFRPFLSVTEIDPKVADVRVQRELLPLLAQMAQWIGAPEAAPGPSRSDLCVGCPVARDCVTRYPARLAARDEPPMGAARPRLGGKDPTVTPLRPTVPPPARAADESAAEKLRRRIETELKREGITVHTRTPIVGPRLILIEVVRPRGSVAALDRAAGDVIHRLTADGLALSYEKQAGTRRFVVGRSDPELVMLGPLLVERAEWLKASPGRFLLGTEPNAAIIGGDLADPATPHLLIAGQAGSGKSWLLRSLIASLVHYHGPAAVRFTLIDPKRVTFNLATFHSAVAAHLDGPVLYGLDDAMPCIERLVEETDERYRLFESAQVTDLVEYNQLVPEDQRLARRILVMDEFGDLTVDPKISKEFCYGVQRLGAKARAAGIHVILATQRPDQKTVPSVLKSNLGAKIALRVASAINSRVILDQGGAEQLLGSGDFLADLGRGILRGQAAVIAV
jgi:DNA segregation ATPase FtsK/SpoIIIE, S-DNA-T family